MTARDPSEVGVRGYFESRLREGIRIKARRVGTRPRCTKIFQNSPGTVVSGFMERFQFLSREEAEAVQPRLESNLKFRGEQPEVHHPQEVDDADQRSTILDVIRSTKVQLVGRVRKGTIFFLARASFISEVRLSFHVFGPPESDRAELLGLSAC